MSRKIFPLIILVLTLVLIAACGGASEPQLASVGVQTGSTPEPTLEPTSGPTVEPAVSDGQSVADTVATTESAATTVKTGPKTSDADLAIPAEITVGGQTFDTGDLMAQALSSPEVFSCLTSKTDVQTLFELADRTPTADEMDLLLPCLADQQQTSAETTSPASTPSPTATPKTILTQALESPGLMWCLSDKVGMDVLIDLENRSATSQESSTIRSCTSDTQEIAAWNAEWPKRIDAAFTPSTCGTPPTTNFPASYYQGPLIDTHMHIPQVPDDQYGEQDTGYVSPRGAESDKYDTISQEQRPLLGRTMNIDRIACTLKNEGSIKAFAFFPTFPEITSPAIEVAHRAVQQYPDLFVPFIQASANGVATLGKILDVMIDVRPGLFAGFGEVGDSPTEPINPLPDSEIYLGDFQVVSDHGNMLVYFHPGVGHQDNLERALQQYSDVTFIIHSDFVRPHVQGIVDRNPNVYYTYNDIFGISGEVAETFRFGEKEAFLADMRAEWDNLLDEADEMYRPMIEAHPDRFMWDTDRGDIVWGYDEEVGQILAEFGRAFIGRFDPAIQADLGYKNAERLIALTTKP